jgi:hypothetical protein
MTDGEKAAWASVRLLTETLQRERREARLSNGIAYLIGVLSAVFAWWVSK